MKNSASCLSIIFLFYLLAASPGETQTVTAPLLAGQQLQCQQQHQQYADQFHNIQDNCRILFNDHSIKCNRLEETMKKQSFSSSNPKLIIQNSQPGMHGCSNGQYIINHSQIQSAQQQNPSSNQNNNQNTQNTDFNQIILNNGLLNMPMYAPQVSNLQHCQNYFAQNQYVYSEDCDIRQANTIPIDIDQHVYITQKDDFSYLETMTDPNFPALVSAYNPQQKESASSSLNALFNRLFTPPTFIFSQQIQTLVESYGEIKLINRSEQYVLQIFDIIQDSNIISFEKRQEDIQPQKERIIKFHVVPEEQGEQQEVNLYFKLRFYDTKLLKPISSKTIQYTILMQEVKPNRYGLKTNNVGKIPAGAMTQTGLRIYNPHEFDLQIKDMVFLKKYVYLVDNMDSLFKEEKSHSLGIDELQDKLKWRISAESEQVVVDFVIHQSQTGTFTDYLRITFEDSSLVLQIPVRLRVVPNGLSFKSAFLHMGLISNRQGQNVRTIIVDNHSMTGVEIRDIIVTFKNNYSCILVEANVETADGCLRDDKKLIVQGLEMNKSIGKLHIFPRIVSLQSNQQRIFEGKIQIITNSTVNDIEQEFKFHVFENLLHYPENSTQFKVGETINNVSTESETTITTKPINSSTAPSKPANIEKRKIEMTNGFPSQVKITALFMPTELINGQLFTEQFELTDFQERILEVNEKKNIFNIRLKTNATQLDSYVLLELNRNFILPVFFKVYNNHLSCVLKSISSEKQIDLESQKQSMDFQDCSTLPTKAQVVFGNKALNSTPVIEFQVKNKNPSFVTLFNVLFFNAPLKLVLEQQLNGQGRILKSKFPVIQETDKQLPLLHLEPNDEATFSIELITNLVSSSRKEDFIQINTNYESFSFGLSYNVVSGDMELSPQSMSFKKQYYQEQDAQIVSISNSFNVPLKVLGISTSDPRFQVAILETSVPPDSRTELFKLNFNLTFGQHIPSFSLKPEDNFISIEDFSLWNATKNMIQAAENNQLSAEILVQLDLKTLKLQATADVRPLRLINETVIEFSNAETNQFYQKTLSFENPLDVPVAFQLFIAPDNIHSPELLLSKQFQFQQEVEIVFCIPLSLRKNNKIKEIYDSFSQLFLNNMAETVTEIQDIEVLKRIQKHPDFDANGKPNLLLIAESIRSFLPDIDSANNLGDNILNNNINIHNKNNKFPENLLQSGFECKEGRMSQRSKTQMDRVDLMGQWVHLLHDLESQSMEQIQKTVEKLILGKREVLSIATTTKARPSLFNYSLRLEKGLLDKIKHYFLWFFQFLLPDSYSATIINWQSQAFPFSTNFKLETLQNQPLQHSSSQQSSSSSQQQQFFLTSEVMNKTIILQPKGKIDLSSIIYLAKYGEAKNNLIIKNNISGIDIIPIRSKSGIGKLTILEVRTLSPFLFANSKEYIARHKRIQAHNQEYIDKNIFIFTVTPQELEGAKRQSVDLLKNFVLKNTGEYPITVKNIYIGSQPCSAYGFFVLGCNCSFKLDPGQERTFTLGYRSEYPLDTVVKSMYFYTATHSLEFQLRGEYFQDQGIDGILTSQKQIDLLNNEQTTQDDSKTGKTHQTQDKNDEINDKEVNSDIQDQNSREDEEIFSKEELRNQELLLALLENIENAAMASSDKSFASGTQGPDWSWMTHQVSDILAKNLKENKRSIFDHQRIHPITNRYDIPSSDQIVPKESIQTRWFVASIVGLTVVFFVYTFVTFLYSDILHLDERHRLKKHLAQNDRTEKIIATSAQQQQQQSQDTNEATDIQIFIDSHGLNNSVLELRGDLLKIKDFQEKKLSEMRLQKQRQMQIRRHKERDLQEIKLSQERQFLENKDRDEEHTRDDKNDEADGEDEEQEFQSKYEINRVQGKLDSEMKEDINRNHHQHERASSDITSQPHSLLLQKELEQPELQHKQQFVQQKSSNTQLRQQQAQQKQLQRSNANAKKKLDMIKLQNNQNNLENQQKHHQQVKITHFNLTDTNNNSENSRKSNGLIDQELIQQKQDQQQETPEINSQSCVREDQNEGQAEKGYHLSQALSVNCHQGRQEVVLVENLGSKEINFNDITQVDQMQKQCEQRTELETKMIKQETMERDSLQNKESIQNFPLLAELNQNNKSNKHFSHLKNETLSASESQIPDSLSTKQQYHGNSNHNSNSTVANSSQTGNNTKKRDFLVYDHISSGGEDEETETIMHLAGRKKPSKMNTTLAGKIDTTLDQEDKSIDQEDVIANIVKDAVEEIQLKNPNRESKELLAQQQMLQFLTQRSVGESKSNSLSRSSSKNSQNNSENEELKTDSDESQLSSGDSLSEEEKDTFKSLSYPFIQPIGKIKLPTQDSEVSSTPPDSFRGIDQPSSSNPLQYGNIEKHADSGSRNFHYQSESSEDESNPVQQRKYQYYNVFSQYSFYPISSSPPQSKLDHEISENSYFFEPNAADSHAFHKAAAMRQTPQFNFPHIGSLQQQQHVGTSQQSNSNSASITKKQLESVFASTELDSLSPSQLQALAKAIPPIKGTNFSMAHIGPPPGLSAISSNKDNHDKVKNESRSIPSKPPGFFNRFQLEKSQSSSPSSMK